MSENQLELKNAPFDTISSVKFSPTNPDQLLVASWDATVRLYDIAKNEQKSKFDHRAAVLAICYSDASHAFSGGLDTSVKQLELELEKTSTLGQHSDSISAVSYSQARSSLVTGSWDRTVRFWDPRANLPGPTHTQNLPERVYHMELVESTNTLVVALASRIIHIYDIRNMVAGPHERESSLKFLTRSLAVMSDGLGYAIGSTEGRIAVEYFDPSAEAQEKKYAFKCHRQTIDDVDHVWPVNALAFHPKYNTFASAGSDATLSIWDHKVKKRLRQFPKYPAPITALAFNNDNKLAVGVGYAWDEGEEGLRKTGGSVGAGIWIRTLGDEVKPKGWTG